MIHLTIAMLRNGRHDPTTIIDEDSLWRATLTPDGPATLHVSGLRDGRLTTSAFGPGAKWLLETVDGVLGTKDVCPTIEPVHNIVAIAQRRFGSFRFPRTRCVYHELIPAVLGQRVTAREAMGQWRELCLRFGAVAPGPNSLLRLPPDPAQIAETPYFVFHKLGIEQKRALALRNVAQNYSKLLQIEGGAITSPSELTSSLTKISGVGQWTAATAGLVAFGDPDALLVGDFHVKNNVAYALTGKPRGTDEEMIELLSPYAGQRARVVKWLELHNVRAPKFGPRQRIQSIVNR